jgi:hypothetical protein
MRLNPDLCVAISLLTPEFGRCMLAELSPGAFMHVSQKDLAAHVGVSFQTASKGLEREAGVASLTLLHRHSTWRPIGEVQTLSSPRKVDA